MKYSIYIDKKLFYQTDDYKDGLSTMLTSTISNQEEIEFFYDNFMYETVSLLNNISSPSKSSIHQT